jgi:hypothetical protein
MKITKLTLKKIIKEEVNKVLSEAQLPNIPGREKFTKVVDPVIAQKLPTIIPEIYRSLEQKHKDALEGSEYDFDDYDEFETALRDAHNAILSKLENHKEIQSAIKNHPVQPGGKLKDYISNLKEMFFQMDEAGYFDEAGYLDI